MPRRQAEVGRADHQPLHPPTSLRRSPRHIPHNHPASSNFQLAFEPLHPHIDVWRNARKLRQAARRRPERSALQPAGPKSPSTPLRPTAECRKPTAGAAETDLVPLQKLRPTNSAATPRSLITESTPRTRGLWPSLCAPTPQAEIGRKHPQHTVATSAADGASVAIVRNSLSFTDTLPDEASDFVY